MGDTQLSSIPRFLISIVSKSRTLTFHTLFAMSVPDSNSRSWGAARTTSDGENPPINRKRSSRAYPACRERKVRCDMVIRGHPCTNCTLDHRTCQFPQVDRRRYSPSISSSILTTKNFVFAFHNDSQNKLGVIAELLPRDVQHC